VIAEEHCRDPVAIVGIACRLPGVNSAAALWDLLLDGRHTISEIPADRFDVNKWLDPAPGRPEHIRTRWGGFLDDVDQFDAGFFGLSAHEALRLDPQHRLILHSAWEAIEDAGFDADLLAGSRTGVYTSCLASDYWDLVRGAGIYDMDSAIGCGSWGMPAARISRLLDLRGPSMGIEAACSSSLLSVHLACHDLWSGQADLAVVSSVNLLLTPDLYFGLSESELLSVHGLSRFGDAAADGYVRSEGVLTAVLKPLAAAQRDGDRIYAAILGTGVTNNGATTDSVLTTSLVAQQDMLRAAYRHAGVAPADVDYVEAHGPGTPRGDEIELTALGAVLSDGRPTDRPCLVGSVKSNVGHTEAPAGLTGLVKAALALYHRWIPATLHVRTPHPVLADPAGPLALATEGGKWPDTDGPALAGVSSFGLNGTNVHMVLRAVEPAVLGTPARPPAALVLPLSARHPDALAALAAAYADRLDTCADDVAANMCFSAGARRTHHRYRIAVAARDATTLAADLRAFASGGTSASVSVHETPTAERPKVVFVFPGQGAQWTGMGRELLATNEVFRAAVRDCDAAIRVETGWSPLELLTGVQPLDGPDVGVERLQPALFTMQVALAAVWRAWGIEPDLVIGQSMGEIAAACVTGALSLADAAAVVCRRGQLLAGLPEPGAMVAVQLGEQAAMEAIGRHVDRVAVGVITGPNSTVLAGEPTALATIVGRLRERGVFCQQVPVRYASHSPQVQPLRPDLLAALAGLRPRRATLPMHSSLLDRELDGTELDGAYWTANLTEPVRLAAALRAAVQDAHPAVFVEISPHPLVRGAIEDILAEQNSPGTVVGSLARDEPAEVTLARNLGAVYAAGGRPAWRAVFPSGRLADDLPRYPWQTRRFWVGGDRDVGPGAAGSAGANEPDEDVFTLEPRSSTSWLAEVRTAVGELAGPGAVTMDDLRVVGGTAAQDGPLRIELRQSADGWRFAVRTGPRRSDRLSNWRLHANGVARVTPATDGRTGPSFDLIRQWCTEPVAHRSASFTHLWRRDGESVGVLTGSVDPLDVCAQALAVTVNGAPATVTGTITAAGLRLAGAPNAAAWVHARTDQLDPDTGAVTGQVYLFDAGHRVLAEARGLRIDGAGPVESPIVDAAPDDTGVTALLSELLDVSVDQLDPNSALSSLGMNSLLATRMRSRLNREFGIETPIRDLLGPRPLGELIKDLQDRLRSRSTERLRS
jgi:acyl transferase domain-containing protein/acyl carrier protein